MKNIHILPTDKPSRLVLDSINNNLFLTTTKSFPSDIMKFKNIYITSDEKIKEGDWCHTIGTSLFNEQIGKVTKQVIADNGKYGVVFKKIILTTDPKLIEDKVQQIDDEFLEWFVKNPSCEWVDIKDLYEYPNVKHIGYKIIIPKEESKQETLEEAKQRILDSNFMTKNDADIFEMGAKWQSERMYSEEEIMDMFHNFSMHLPLHYEFLVKEQFKKK